MVVVLSIVAVAVIVGMFLMIMRMVLVGCSVRNVGGHGQRIVRVYHHRGDLPPGKGE